MGRSCWDVPGPVAGGHQPLRHPCQEVHHHGERHKAGQEDQGGTRLLT